MTEKEQSEQDKKYRKAKKINRRAAKDEIKVLHQKYKEDVHAIKEKYLNYAANIEFIPHPKRYSTGEEIFNSITHGVGTGLAIAALVLLIVRAVLYAPIANRGFYITGFTLFGVSMIILYLMSTLYHALVPYGAKKVFAVFDHSSIYILIAGTYTPFCLTVLRGPLGWTLFGVIWGLAVIGITFYSIFGSRMRILSVITYVLMGWMIIFAIKPMIAVLPRLSVVLLVGGGIAYTIGVIFYALKKIKWTHSVWHLFVMAGTIFHFFSVYFSIGNL